MSLIESSKPRVVALADQIQADIKSRRLAVGDAYLTTAEVARMLRVSTAAANKSLQLLVQKGVLVRRNRSGCVIAETHTPDAVLGRIHILVHRDHMRTEGLFADGLIVGLQGELGGAEVLFNFLPQHGEDDFVRGVIAEAMRQPVKSGFVLARSSYSLQTQIAATGVPAVVLGTSYRAVRGLASLDRDHAASGRLLARKMLDKGCRRLIVLMRHTEWPGDFAFLDAIQRELSVAGILPDHLRIRHLPPEEEAIAAEMEYLLAEDEGRTGVIARSEPLANGAIRTINRKKMSNHVWVSASDIYRGSTSEPPPYLFIKSLWSAEQIGEQLGRMLKQQALGQKLKNLEELIPVVLGRN